MLIEFLVGLVGVISLLLIGTFVYCIFEKRNFWDTISEDPIIILPAGCLGCMTIGLIAVAVFGIISVCKELGSFIFGVFA